MTIRTIRITVVFGGDWTAWYDCIPGTERLMTEKEVRDNDTTRVQRKSPAFSINGQKFVKARYVPKKYHEELGITPDNLDKKVVKASWWDYHMSN